MVYIYCSHCKWLYYICNFSPRYLLDTSWSTWQQKVPGCCFVEKHIETGNTSINIPIERNLDTCETIRDNVHRQKQRFARSRENDARFRGTRLLGLFAAARLAFIYHGAWATIPLGPAFDPFFSAVPADPGTTRTTRKRCAASWTVRRGRPEPSPPTLRLYAPVHDAIPIAGRPHVTESWSSRGRRRCCVPHQS